MIFGVMWLRLCYCWGCVWSDCVSVGMSFRGIVMLCYVIGVMLFWDYVMFGYGM